MSMLTQDTRKKKKTKKRMLQTVGFSEEGNVETEFLSGQETNLSFRVTGEL